MSAENSKGETEQGAQDNPAQSVQEGTGTKTPPTGEEQNNSPILRILKDPQWWQSFAAAVLVPVGAYALWIYSGQLYEMRKSTAIASDNYRLQTEALHIDQRAWAADDSISGKPEEGKPYQITVTIRNTGKTFAKKFAGVSAIRIKQLSDPDPNYEDILREGKDVSNTVGLIAPNGIRRQIINVSNGAKMTKENLEELKAPTVVILVFGKITYEDIFRCSHWTIYCYRGYIDGTWETYGSYNDADEDYCP